MRHPNNMLGIRARNMLNWELMRRRGLDPEMRPAEDPDPKLVAELSEAEMMEIPNVGKRTVVEVVEWLAHFGLTPRL